MRQSMTGFASGQGDGQGLRWTWDVRSVNAKGLDIRLRLPDWIEGLEAAVKAALAGRVARGNVTLGLRVQGAAEAGAQSLDPAQLAAVMDAMTAIETEAMARGLSLAPSTAAQVVQVRGVMAEASATTDVAALRADLLANVAPVLDAFVAMRAQEGAALQAVLEAQVAEIARLTDAASGAAEARRDDQETRLRAALARVMDNTDGMDPQRVAQELALIAVKADITEELDRLRAHIQAARTLLAEDGPIGRKLDFLMQEFNREANTLCSKSGSADLTQIGLALKTVIDQMREQVQNVE